MWLTVWILGCRPKAFPASWCLWCSRVTLTCCMWVSLTNALVFLLLLHYTRDVSVNVLSDVRSTLLTKLWTLISQPGRQIQFADPLIQCNRIRWVLLYLLGLRSKCSLGNFIKLKEKCITYHASGQSKLCLVFSSFLSSVRQSVFSSFFKMY